MSQTKHLKGECQHCGGHLSFPAEGIGLTATCPHCGQETELFLATQKQESSVPTKAIVYTVIALLILGGGTAALLIRLKHEQRLIAEKKRTQEATNASSASALPTPDKLAAEAGFHISAIKLEKTKGSSLVYAVGSLKNQTSKRRFGVKLELDLFDDAGNKTGSASDYQQALEAKAEWKFKALVVGSKTVSAKLASIKEEQ